jgi:hypothetical protein
MKRLGAELRAIASRILRSPVLSEAIWALRSPQFWSGMRTLRSMMRSTCSFITPRIDELHRREADALLMDLRQRSRQRGRHRAAHIGVVDMADGEADSSPSKIGIHRCMSGAWVQTIAGIGVVGDADVARLVVRDRVDGALVVEPDEPGRAEILRAGEGLPAGRGQAAGEILGLLDEGGMGRAQQRVGHASRPRPRNGSSGSGA